jgi:hypothetical protein
MSLRKFLNLPNKEQSAKKTADMDAILEVCSEIATKERADMRQDQEMHNGVCPNCRAKKSDNSDAIVDRISNVQGKGSVGGNAFGVSGSVLIQTSPVNHCNKCGHEWEKFKTKSISQTHILRVCLNYLGEILKDPTQKSKDWKLEAVRKAFNGCYAESIFSFVQKEWDFLYTDTCNKCTLRRLRKHYQSLYDLENNEKLEKI